MTRTHGADLMPANADAQHLCQHEWVISSWNEVVAKE